MKQWKSSKWVCFGRRPTSLLQRQFRKYSYLLADKISSLYISKLLVIGENNTNAMFILKKENEQNEKIVEKDYKSKKALELLQQFLETINNFGKSSKDAVDVAIKACKELGPMLVYSHYIEHVLTKEMKNFDKSDNDIKQYLSRLIEINSKIRDKAIKIVDSFYEEAHKQLQKKFPNKDIDYYLLDELEKKELNQNSRKKFYVYLTLKEKSYIYVNHEAKEFLKKEGFTKKTVDMPSELKGFPAYKGKVKGDVVIIHTIKDCKKLTSSSIAVAPMTMVQYTHYLKKVKALVTDEGGINSHAAIVARELKIPCIVGTKYATQALRDRDYIEVNANKGIVRKIR